MQTEEGKRYGKDPLLREKKNAAPKRSTFQLDNALKIRK